MTQIVSPLTGYTAERATARSGHRAADQRQPGFVAALAHLIVRPATTLAHLSSDRRLSAWLPVLIIVAVAVATTITKSYADSRYFYEDQVRYYTQHPEFGPAGGITLVMPPIGTVMIRIGEQLAGLVGSWALWTAVLYVTSVVSAHGHASFTTAARLTLWSWIPYAIRGLLQIVYMLLAHDPIFNPGLSSLVLDNTPPSMGDYEYVMVPRSARLWGAVLSYVDIYLFWHLLLVWLGMPTLTKLSRKWTWLIILLATAMWIGIRLLVEIRRYRY